MTIKRIEQEETSLKQKIEEKLILVMQIWPNGQLELAKSFGYEKDVFSQIKSGFSNGSKQLLKLLEQYIELETLKTENLILVEVLKNEEEMQENRRTALKKIRLKEVGADANSTKNQRIPNQTAQAVAEFLKKSQDGNIQDDPHRK